MIKKLVTALAISVTCLLGGCATTGTDGFVALGGDQYMIGGLGKFTDFSGSAVKARFFQDATKFCAEKGLAMIPGTSTSKDVENGHYASAEIQFRCASVESK